MGQVPNRHYLIVGDGKVGRHFSEYFRLAGVRFRGWSRSVKQRECITLEAALEPCDTALLLISDSAIEQFIRQHSCLGGKKLVHFSGSLATHLALGIHPLMTFGPEVYDLPTYEDIPFVCEKAVEFTDIFPSLKNPHFYVQPELKPLYHALCVMSGNFTTLLWQKLFTEFENRLGIPRQAAIPYLRQTAKNLEAKGLNALTGPLQRGDRGTIAKNIAALEGDPFQEIYKSVASVFATKPTERDNTKETTL
ncbi:MAG: DUF2520 domain-containing protein [Bdellovibrionota bacterium]